ncbi:hypothetical protein HYH03_003907 [Edaphochlamys debaryana]|uniref:Transmembrane protein n=1 Tax=Edaphochlamys debaryana TaxID=47281 RepID=A0A835YAJ0_9CHLO|nr:hypothetical protein HYH03_003907 [Edaphochlamys debaryana]|eukprot:KAG2498149.1 hypothetical protein HYH03_003907 [Edaphochlamys debaryana]
MSLRFFVLLAVWACAGLHGSEAAQKKRGTPVKGEGAWGKAATDAASRAQEEAAHIADRLRDKKHVTRRLSLLQRDLTDFLTITASQLYELTAPQREAAMASWTDFKARMRRTADQLRPWCTEQHRAALKGHKGALEALHRVVQRQPSLAGVISRQHVEMGMYIAYSGAVAVALSLLLRFFF